MQQSQGLSHEGVSFPLPIHLIGATSRRPRPSQAESRRQKVRELIKAAGIRRGAVVCQTGEGAANGPQAVFSVTTEQLRSFLISSGRRAPRGFVVDNGKLLWQVVYRPPQGFAHHLVALPALQSETDDEYRVRTAPLLASVGRCLVQGDRFETEFGEMWRLESVERICCALQM